MYNSVCYYIPIKSLFETLNLKGGYNKLPIIWLPSQIHTMKDSAR